MKEDVQNGHKYKLLVSLEPNIHSKITESDCNLPTVTYEGKVTFGWSVELVQTL